MTFVNRIKRELLIGFVTAVMLVVGFWDDPKAFNLLMYAMAFFFSVAFGSHIVLRMYLSISLSDLAQQIKDSDNQMAKAIVYAATIILLCVVFQTASSFLFGGR
jgi:hypothetical protein